MLPVNLTINDTHYPAAYFSQQAELFSQLDSLRNIHDLRIAVCLEDTAQWLALCFYCQQQQISVMPIHPSNSRLAAERLATKAGCQRLFYQSLTEAISLPGAPESSAHDPGLIQMSSGTTGDPKCIHRSWASIEVELESYTTHFSEPASMTPVIACPVTHSYGLICGVMAALKRGQEPIVVTSINPKYLVKRLQGCDQPLLYASPTLLQGLLRLWPAQTPLHAAMTSGTIMPRQLVDQLRARITHLFQQYGCSEAGCISINRQLSDASNMGTVLPHLSLSAGINAEQPDEIIVKQTLAGKINTIHTQDLGYLRQDDEGIQHLHFISRLDDTIIVAGLNVYPQEVEDVILQHPAIADAVVFKINDTFAGQRVGLLYVAKEPLTAQDLRQWCQHQLASYQLPHQLMLVESIERMPNGKINRKKIAQDFLQQNQTPQPTPAVAPAAP